MELLAPSTPLARDTPALRPASGAAAPPAALPHRDAEAAIGPRAATTFVAVTGPNEAPDPDTEARPRHEARTPGSRLHDAALESVSATSALWMAVALAALGAAGSALLLRRTDIAWAALPLLTAVALAALLVFAARGCVCRPRHGGGSTGCSARPPRPPW